MQRSTETWQQILDKKEILDDTAFEDINLYHMHNSILYLLNGTTLRQPGRNVQGYLEEISFQLFAGHAYLNNTIEENFGEWAIYSSPGNKDLDL